MSADSAPLRDWGISRLERLDRPELCHLADWLGLRFTETTSKRQLAIGVFMKALDFGTFTIEDFR